MGDITPHILGIVQDWRRRRIGQKGTVVMNIVTYRCDEFYISYMNAPSELANMLDSMAAAFGASEPTGSNETAICVHTDESGLDSIRFYILYGDHREAYQALAPQGLHACMDYFKANIKLIGHSSNRA